MTSRIFIGLALPHSLRRQLAMLPLALDGAKWTSLQNFHLTLAFIGEVGQETIDAISRAMTQVHEQQFPLALRGMGHFDKRILWAGATSHPQLHALHSKICAMLDTIPIDYERRPFIPHVTLARLRNSVDETALNACIEQHNSFKTPAFTVERFQLFESVSTPEGVRYTPLAHFPLSTA